MEQLLRFHSKLSGWRNRCDLFLKIGQPALGRACPLRTGRRLKVQMQWAGFAWKPAHTNPLRVLSDAHKFFEFYFDRIKTR